MKSKSLLFALVAVAGAQPVLACDFCSIYSAAHAGGTVGRGFYSSLALQYTDFGTLQTEGQKIANADNEYIHSTIVQVVGGYNFTDRLGAQVNVPFIRREYGWSDFKGSDLGLGDLSLVGNWVAFRRMEEHTTLSWTLLGGLKLPTGSVSWLGDRGGNIGLLASTGAPLGIGGHDLALGSGSVDGILGTSVLARWKRLFFSASMQAAFRTEGAYQHQYANDLSWSGGPGVYLAIRDNYTAALQCVVSGETKGKDSVAGVDDPDSAATSVFLGPQVNVTWSDTFSAQAGVELPVSIHNSTTQLMPSYRIRAAFNWRF